MTALMLTRSAERINYLALALGARRAIKGLKMLLRTKHVPPEAREALQSAVNSVKALAAPGKLYSELHNEGGYDRSEAIQTLQEVADQMLDGRLLASLEAIIAGTNTEEDVHLAIRFFSAIEKRALHHYDDPSLAETG